MEGAPLVISRSSERLGALMEMLGAFYTAPMSDEGIKALAAFSEATTPLNEDAHKRLMNMAQQFARWFDAIYDLNIGDTPGARQNLEGNWLLGVKLGIEIGMATERVASN